MGRVRGKICKFYCASDVIGIRCRVLVLIVQGRVKCQNTEYKRLFVLTRINNKHVNLLNILHLCLRYLLLRLFRFGFYKSQIPPCFNNVNMKTKHVDVCNTYQYSIPKRVLQDTFPNLQARLGKAPTPEFQLEACGKSQARVLVHPLIFRVASWQPKPIKKATYRPPEQTI